MKSQIKSIVRVLFLDIGGVLLTDGRDHHARKRAAKEFDLALGEINLRHHFMFETYEERKIIIDEHLIEHLNQLVFYEKRLFTRTRFRTFMFAQSHPYPQMIEFFSHLKNRYRLKIAVVSNDAREINASRIQKFKLGKWVDFFVSASFVHLRKPDADIFRLALDMAQVSPRDVLYVDDRSTRIVLKQFGLEIQS